MKRSEQIHPKLPKRPIFGEDIDLRHVKIKPLCLPPESIKIDIDENERAEFIGQLIDVFEDFLEEKGINIPNEEKEDSDDPAILYGSDYGYLESEIMDTLVNWGAHHSKGNTMEEDTF